jgi:hypothetical protein
MMTKEKIIEASAVSVLKMVIRSIMEHCFLLAHENELSDLKRVIPAEDIGEYDEDGRLDWSVDMELLNLVLDKPVVYLMNMIRKIEGHINEYTKTNDLDHEEILADEQIMEQTASTWLYIIGQMKYQSYREILDTLGWLIECYGMVIWNLAHQQILGLADVFLETEMQYYSWDGAIASLDISNKNALFLLNIYADIQLDAAQLEQFIKDYNGKV